MLLILALSSIVGLASGSIQPGFAHQPTTQPFEYCPVIYTDPPKNCRPLPDTFGKDLKNDFEPPRAGHEVIQDAFGALEDLQDEFFDPDFGTWPSSIDWTGAVVETIVSGMLTTLTKTFDALPDGLENDRWTAKENLLSSYYAEIINSYYGQDILSLRGEVREVNSRRITFLV
jgi:hypothetical protein